MKNFFASVWLVGIAMLIAGSVSAQTIKIVEQKE